MTVYDLIEILRTHDPALPVRVGMDEDLHVEASAVALSTYWTTNRLELTPCVVIARRSLEKREMGEEMQRIEFPSKPRPAPATQTDPAPPS